MRKLLFLLTTLSTSLIVGLSSSSELLAATSQPALTCADTLGNSDKELEATIHASIPDFIDDHDLIVAIIKAESNFEPTAVSPKAAVGLMQLTTVAVIDAINLHPHCKKYQNVVIDLVDIRTNIEIGSCFLDLVMSNYVDGSLILALAYYNGGNRQVSAILNSRSMAYETAAYIAKVLYFKEMCNATKYSNSSSSASNNHDVNWIWYPPADDSSGQVVRYRRD